MVHKDQYQGNERLFLAVALVCEVIFKFAWLLFVKVI